METDATFIRTDAVVVLHAVAHVGLHFALVVHPVHAELVYAVGDAQPLDELGLFKFGVLVILFFNRCEYFLYCLMVFGFIGKAQLDFV